jgi:hypothetical protein
LLASQKSLFDFLYFAPDLLVQITNLVVRYSTERPDHLHQAQTAKENPQSTLMQLSKKALIHLFIGSWSVLSTESYKLSAKIIPLYLRYLHRQKYLFSLPLASLHPPSNGPDHPEGWKVLNHATMKIQHAFLCTQSGRQL